VRSKSSPIWNQLAPKSRNSRAEVWKNVKELIGTTTQLDSLQQPHDVVCMTLRSEILNARTPPAGEHNGDGLRLDCPKYGLNVHIQPRFAPRCTLEARWGSRQLCCKR